LQKNSGRCGQPLYFPSERLLPFSSCLSYVI